FGNINRKLRKEAKKKGISRKPKKDIGVPNSAPFKEEALREAELQNHIFSILLIHCTVNNWTSQMACTLVQVIEESDVIVEVLDARDPLGCCCPQPEETVLKHEGKKKLLFILNKIDLVPKENVEKWFRYLEAECPTFLFKASMQKRNLMTPYTQGINAVLDHSRAASCFGRDCLLQTLTDLADKKDAETMLKVGVVCFPNVGKSSIINSLKEIRVCHVGVQRGVTRCKQELHITKRVKMIDSPGIVAAPSNPGVAMALRSLQVEEKEESPLEAVRTLLKQCNQQHVRNITAHDIKTGDLKRGFLQKGGVPNTELAAMTFLSDWTGPKLSYHSRAPESDLNLDIVRKGNENVMKGTSEIGMI
uniref:Guanine nucleotide-binding protein-like 3 n=1 Tax=Cyprinus carpio TaxID=7962 RepID=A0A8C1ND84_CYPCA